MPTGLRPWRELDCLQLVCQPRPVGQAGNEKSPMAIKRSRALFSGSADDLHNKLRSFDLLVFCFAPAVVGGTFSVVCFFYFVTWLGHLDSPVPVFRNDSCDRVLMLSVFGPAQISNRADLTKGLMQIIAGNREKSGKIEHGKRNDMPRSKNLPSFPRLSGCRGC